MDISISTTKSTKKAQEDLAEREKMEKDIQATLTEKKNNIAELEKKK